MKQTIYLIVAAILTANALGLGIAPASIDIDHGTESIEKMLIINNEDKDIDVVLYAQGELAEYLEVSDAIIHLTPGQDTVPFKLKVKSPLLSTPGKHEIELVAMEVPRKEANQGTMIVTRQAVISKVNIVVPYPGKYAEGTLHIPDPVSGEPINFVIKLRNLGRNPIDEASARIELYSPTNDLIATLESDRKPVKPKEMRELVARYHNALNTGKYYVKAFVNYDGEEFMLEEVFEIGNLLINIDNIYVKNFRIGEIAKFDIIVESKWNEPIPDVFADMEIRDKFGQVEAMYKTTETDVPAYSKEFLEAYWDTRDASVGKYNAKITLHFLGNNLEKSITLNVREDSIDIDHTPTARLIDQPQSQGNSTILVLVVISIVFNIAIFALLARRKK